MAEFIRLRIDQDPDWHRDIQVWPPPEPAKPPKRTRYTCVAGSGEPVVEREHPIGSQLNCPYCGTLVTVGASTSLHGAAVMPFHNLPTKRERAAMRRAAGG
jgi:hypothetical protein